MAEKENAHFIARFETTVKITLAAIVSESKPRVFSTFLMIKTGIDLIQRLALISLAHPGKENKPMNLIFAIMTLAAVMTFCNFSDLTKKAEQPQNTAMPVRQQPTPKPTLDKEALKRELVRMEMEMTGASMKGDITLIAKNTTDDFELTNPDGKVQNKNQALADVKEEKNIRSWTITDADLVSASEDSAVLKYVMGVALKTGQSGKARVTDTFVKKDGRWLIRSEQQTLIR